MRFLPQSEWGGTAALEQYASVQKILDGTLRAIRNVGIRRLSMSDISDASGVSRGTLYRYFTSKEHVLSAVSEYICASFEQGIAEAAEGIEDPIERFRAVMRFYGRFTIEQSPEGIFEVEPAFHLNFLRTHFSRHTAAVKAALDPVLDHFERLMARPVNREMFCDTLVRMQLSTLIIPATPEWLAIWNSAPGRLREWALQIAAHHTEHKKG